MSRAIIENICAFTGKKLHQKNKSKNVAAHIMQIKTDLCTKQVKKNALEFVLARITF